jgi:Firmicute plasmid replication protein (RepL)
MYKKKLVKEFTHQVVDENGELKEMKQSQVFSVEREPDYVKLYVDDVMKLSDIPKSASSVLFAIVRRMSYTNDIALYAPIKREIEAELGIKEVTLKKAIDLFIDKSILFRKARGLYTINPYLFGRGKWEDIKKVRLGVEYSKAGKTVLKTEFEYEEVQGGSQSE